MRKIFKILAFSISMLSFYSVICLSADISISATVDRSVIPIDEQLTLEVNVSGNVSSVPNPTLSDLPNFTVYSSGRSQSISIINGQMSSSVNFKYTLVPRSTGKFSIPPITLSFEGKAYSSQPIPIEVTPAGTNPPQTGTAQAETRTTAATESKAQKLFVTASIDKKHAYVNEQIVYTFRFFRRIQLLSNPQYHGPDFSGFWTEDTPPKNYSTVLNGVQYLVSEVKTLLFPTKSGIFEIGSATLSCNIEDFSRNDPFADSFFSGFFSSGKTQVLHTSPQEINVKALPEKGKPGNFNGAVGNFKIASAIDKNTSKAGEPLTLTVTISGTGNIKTLPEPDLSNIPGFRKYETVSSMDVDSSQAELKGSKKFKTVIVPETPGKKTISPVSFTFFDPIKDTYVTEKSNSLYVDIKPAEPGTIAPYAGIKESKAEIKILNQDIEYIKNLSSWQNYTGPVYKKPLFIVAVIFPLFPLLFTFLFVRWNEKMSSDISFARRIRASKTARKYLKKAKALMSPEKSYDYYCAISKSLLQYTAHKLNVSAEGLTLNNLEEMLLKNKVSSETITELKKILSECDMVKFSPSQVSPEMTRDTFQYAQDLIEKLEKELK